MSIETMVDFRAGLRELAGPEGALAGVGFKAEGVDIRECGFPIFVDPAAIRGFVFELGGSQLQRENITLLWPYDDGERTYMDALMERRRDGKMVRYSPRSRSRRRFEYYDLNPAGQTPDSSFLFPNKKALFDQLSFFLMKLLELREGEFVSPTLALPKRWIFLQEADGILVPKDTKEVDEATNELVNLFSPPFPGCGEARSTGVAELQDDGSVKLNGDTYPPPDPGYFHENVTQYAPIDLRPKLTEVGLGPAWGSGTKNLVKAGEGIFSPVRRGTPVSDPIARFMAVMGRLYKNHGEKLQSELATYYPGPSQVKPGIKLEISAPFQVVNKYVGDPLGSESGRTGDFVFQSRMNRFRVRKPRT